MSKFYTMIRVSLQQGAAGFSYVIIMSLQCWLRLGRIQPSLRPGQGREKLPQSLRLFLKWSQKLRTSGTRQQHPRVTLTATTAA